VVPLLIGSAEQLPSFSSHRESGVHLACSASPQYISRWRGRQAPRFLLILHRAVTRKKIRILLIEDNRILRDGIAAIIDAEADMRVVASSPGGERTLALTRDAKPHVVLIDLGLRNQSGLHVVKALAALRPAIKVIGMGLVPSQEDIVECVQAGASGFILKEATVADVLWTIRTVARGNKVLPPLLTGSLFTHVLDLAIPGGIKGSIARNAIRMTKREREIIALISEGLTNKEIAQRLSIAVDTVKSHVHNILEKMALHNRLQIAIHTQEGRGT
jgi:DNA-binding NarL/FixJ family response regulator